MHTSIAKALSGLGLIPIPKCFTANVITSPCKSHSLNGASRFLPVLFHFQFLLPCHPLVFRLHLGVTSEHTDIDQRSTNVYEVHCTLTTNYHLEYMSSMTAGTSLSFHSVPTVNPENTKATAVQTEQPWVFKCHRCFALLYFNMKSSYLPGA